MPEHICLQVALKKGVSHPLELGSSNCACPDVGDKS